MRIERSAGAEAGVQPAAAEALCMPSRPPDGPLSEQQGCTGARDWLPAELRLQRGRRRPRLGPRPRQLTWALGRCRMRRCLRPAGAAPQPALPDAPPGWRAPAACRGRPCCGLRRSRCRWGAAPPPRPPGTLQARQRRALPRRRPKPARPPQVAPAHTVTAGPRCTTVDWQSPSAARTVRKMCPWLGSHGVRAALLNAHSRSTAA